MERDADPLGTSNPFLRPLGKTPKKKIKLRPRKLDYNSVDSFMFTPVSVNVSPGAGDNGQNGSFHPGGQECAVPSIPQPGFCPIITQPVGSNMNAQVCGQGFQHSTPLNQTNINRSQFNNPFLSGVGGGVADANLNGQNRVGSSEACGGDQVSEHATVPNQSNVNRSQATNPFSNGSGCVVAGADAGQQLLAGISVLGGVGSDKQTMVSGNVYFEENFFEFIRCISYENYPFRIIYLCAIGEVEIV